MYAKATDMLKLSILIKKITSTNAGNVTQKENSMSTNPRLWSMMMLMVLVVLTTSSCTEFAILSSGAGIAVSQNIYAKTYSGVDVLTIISTEKDIKTHAYERLKREKDEQ
tara:strand:- start:750 stop:1079 length:330 start_codon:yes stop_codon:yes gene_type:complete